MVTEFHTVILYPDGNNHLPLKDYTMSDEKQTQPEWILTTEAAEITGLTRHTIAEYCRRYDPDSDDNKLICKKIGRDWWVLRESAEQFEPDDKNRGRPRLKKIDD